MNKERYHAATDLSEEVHLTRKRIKQLILPRSNIPSTIPQLGIKALHQLILRRYGVAPIIRLLGYTRHVANRTLVEFSNGLILKDVTAFDLASGLVCLAIARIDTDDVGKAVGVEDTLG